VLAYIGHHKRNQKEGKKQKNSKKRKKTEIDILFTRLALPRTNTGRACRPEGECKKTETLEEMVFFMF
jgi:hypothetical protein